jgi:hypothetical protein
MPDLLQLEFVVAGAQAVAGLAGVDGVGAKIKGGAHFVQRAGRQQKFGGFGAHGLYCPAMHLAWRRLRALQMPGRWHHNSAMEKQILIAGGGIGGLAAALACSRAGWSATLMERTREFGEVGAGIQMGPNVVRRLHAWGLEDDLKRWPRIPRC